MRGNEAFPTVVYLNVALIVCVWTTLASGQESIRIKKYEDKNGYFVAFPPCDWTQQDYPEETVRSKVAFQSGDVIIRVIAGPLPSGINTLDDLYSQVQEQLSGVQNIKSLQKTRRGCQEAVVARIDTRNAGGATQEIVQYANTTLWFSIALNCPSLTSLDNNKQLFDSFLQTFLMFESREKFTEQQKEAAQAAKYVRLVKNMREMGNADLAQVYLKEGLQSYPNDKDLQALEAEMNGGTPQTTVTDTKGEINNSVERLKETGPNSTGSETSPNTESSNSTTSQGDDAQDTLFYVILALIGAVCVTFRKGIANGTPWPGFARLTAPIIGCMLMFVGIVKGLFDEGRVFLGIVTSVVVLAILVAPIWLIRANSGTDYEVTVFRSGFLACLLP